MFDQYLNGKARAVKMIANIQIVVSIIAGIILGNLSKDFSWGIALYIWASSIFAAVILHGFAEIIELLTRIYKGMDVWDEIKNKMNRPVA